VNRVVRILRSLSCLMLVVLLLSAQLPAKAAVAGSSTLANKGAKYVVIASELNFRSGPGVGYSVIKGLRKGTQVTYVGYKSGWWLVQTSDGRQGYVDRKYLTPATASKTGTYYVTATNLRVRKSPSTSAGTRGYVSRGTRLTISQLNGDWGYVSGGASVNGWVALKYLSTSSVSSSSSSSSSSSASSSYGAYYVTASTLNVRKSASRSASRIDALGYGTGVSVSRTSGSWSYISYSKGGSTQYGWVSSEYLKSK